MASSCLDLGAVPKLDYAIPSSVFENPERREIISDDRTLRSAAQGAHRDCKLPSISQATIFQHSDRGSEPPFVVDNHQTLCEQYDLPLGISPDSVPFKSQFLHSDGH